MNNLAAVVTIRAGVQGVAQSRAQAGEYPQQAVLGSQRRGAGGRRSRRDNKMADYRIEQGGTVVVYLSEKATNWVTGPKPAVGARLAFKTKFETEEFVGALEAEGFTFEGKQYLTAA